MPTFADLTGRRFGRLVVLHREPTVNLRTRWAVRCDCGTQKVVPAQSLTPARYVKPTNSCGCLQREKAANRMRIHGLAGTPQHDLYVQAKRRAKTIGVAFALTLEDIVVPDVCPVLGIPLCRGGGVHHAGSPTLDRMEPKGGYTPENVRVISYRANAIKSDATVQDLRRIIDYMEGRP